MYELSKAKIIVIKKFYLLPNICKLYNELLKV